MRRGMATRIRVVLVAMLVLTLSTPALYDAALGQVVPAPDSPPPPQVESPGPPPNAGAVWIAGHWTWSGGKFVWTPGRWETPPPGQAWVPGRWKKTAAGWVWEPGRWRR